MLTKDPVHGRSKLVFSGIVILFLSLMPVPAPLFAADKDGFKMDIQETTGRLKEHLNVLTRSIGERSVYRPENLKKTENYIRSTFRDMGLNPRSQTYRYEQMEVANVEAEVSFGRSPAKRYVLGAHYDSVAGTVGADDNASAVAVMLETARELSALKTDRSMDVAVEFVAFALSPFFGYHGHPGL